MLYRRAESPDEKALEQLVADYVNTLNPQECVALLGGGAQGLLGMLGDPAHEDQKCRASAIVYLSVMEAIAGRLASQVGWDDAIGGTFGAFMATFAEQYNSIVGGA